MKRREFCRALAAALAAGALAPCAAAQAETPAAALVGHAVPDDYYSLSFRSDRKEADLSHSYYYSDSLFDHSALEYDNRLALVTLGMTAAGSGTWASDAQYWKEGEVGRAAHIRDGFEKLGFAEVALFNYDHSLNEAPSTSACAIARKTLVQNGERVTVIAAFLRGAGYGAEWADNFRVGSGTAHAGFVAAARQLVEPVQRYVEESAARQPLGTLKFWLGGYSRGGAVANLLAARLPAMLPQLKQENTFVYTFAAPMALTSADCPELQQDYDNNHAADGRLKRDWTASNIFNLVSSGDIVPRVMPVEWGCHRNGNDRFLPATRRKDELQALDAMGAELDGGPLAFSQLGDKEDADAMMAAMLRFFGSRENYHENYETAFHCMVQCAFTRSEAEVVEGRVLDDEAVVARLRSMEEMQQFSWLTVLRNVLLASTMSRPILEKLGDVVPLVARQIVVPVLAVGLCYGIETDALKLIVYYLLSLYSVRGQINDLLQVPYCHFVENYATLLEYYDPAEHGMVPYTRTER